MGGHPGAQAKHRGLNACRSIQQPTARGSAGRSALAEKRGGDAQVRFEPSNRSMRKNSIHRIDLSLSDARNLIEPML
jgi:hypothetical protein